MNCMCCDDRVGMGVDGDDFSVGFSIPILSLFCDDAVVSHNHVDAIFHDISVVGKFEIAAYTVFAHFGGVDAGYVFQ